MITDPDPLALELDRLAREFRPMLDRAAPAGPPPPDPRGFHAAPWAIIFTAALAALLGGMAGAAAIRWALGLPILGGP